MLKTAGIMLLLIMSVITGCCAAEGLKKRVKSMKLLRVMLEKLCLMIRYEALEVTEIVHRLSEDKCFTGLEFTESLNEYVSEMAECGNMTFYEAWDRAVSENTGSFIAEDVLLIRRIGSVLGSCDCDGQISALSLICAEADRLADEAAEQYKTKGRLYRSLGAVGGALIAMIAV